MRRKNQSRCPPQSCYWVVRSDSLVVSFDNSVVFFPWVMVNMFDLKIDLGRDFLNDEIKEFEKQRLTVGVLDRSIKTAKSKPKSDGFKNFPNGKALKLRGRDKSFPMWQLADLLDWHYGFISDAPDNPKNTELNRITQELLKIFEGGVNPKRIENAGRALVRNQILRRDFGNNATSTVNSKGFDQPLVRTGALFNSITARYDP